MNQLANATQFFSFNATSVNRGSYTITIYATNITGTISRNISLVIDGVTPYIAFGNGASGNNSNLSQGNIYTNVTVTEDYDENTVVFRIFNSSGEVNMTYNYSVSQRTINVTLLKDGDYTYNVSVNDSVGNMNTTETRTITLDDTNPVVSFDCADLPTDSIVRAGDTITCSCDATDATSGLNDSVSFTVNPLTSTVGTFTTTCTSSDYAGNYATHNISYTVNRASSVSTGGGGTSTWTNTHIVSDEQFTQGFTKQLGVENRMKIQINNKNHYVGVKSLTTTTAKIEISSTPQEATLSIGDERKFDVDEDNYYDLNVILNSIESSKADITIKSINELITNQTIAEEEGKEEVATEQEINEGKLNKIWLWIIIGIIVALIIGVGYKLKNR